MTVCADWITNTDVNMVTFTGSEGVGRHIGEVTGRNLVPAALELGGKSACVVLDCEPVVSVVSPPELVESL